MLGIGAERPVRRLLLKSKERRWWLSAGGRGGAELEMKTDFRG